MNFKYYKTNALLVLVAILIIIANILIKVFGPYANNLTTGRFKEEIETISDYLGVFGVLGIVGVFLWLIDNYLWKTWAFNWLVDLPNISGRYTGLLQSDYNGNFQMHIVLEICQTASGVKINGYFANHGTTIQTSTSYSYSELIAKGQDGFFTLSYQFANAPNLTSTQIYQHGGTVSLKYFPDIKVLTGEYYNIRKNLGSIDVSFVDEKLLGRFQ
ncbi:hypothetical protein [Pedobacter cryoconitis]|uniref:Cap15 family cyclic dinucleotide receptor domain-containing protein n=1 Tax=Pedobacter cryoconitis TaxID=188932 RepID=UPI001610C216|nr:hypothetical protein [Pedobacter cryoconitis]MBB5645984.1 hypothetical protein [Pedobacter cryoconitis]